MCHVSHLPIGNIMPRESTGPRCCMLSTAMWTDRSSTLCTATETVGSDTELLVGDVIDLSTLAQTIGDTTPVFVLRVTADYEGAGTVAFSLRTSSSAAPAFGDTSVLLTTPALSNPAPGDLLATRLPLANVQRFLSLWAVFVGDVAGGSVSAFFVETYSLPTVYGAAV